MTAALRLDGVTVTNNAGGVLVDSISLQVAPGNVLGIVGESGSGKTALALAALGYARPGTRLTAGTVRVAGGPVLDMRSAELRALRGRTIAYVPQHPGAALDPTVRIGRTIAEVANAHAADVDVAELLAGVGLPGDADFQKRYPHELSGGQQQRVALAVALSGDPEVVVLDEPTTGLDAVTQAQVLTELRRIADERGTALVYISHDLATVAALADDVAVLRGGALIEHGPCGRVLTEPVEEYTRELLDAVPDIDGATRVAASAESSSVAALLEVHDLQIVHRSPDGARTRAADSVGFSVHAGRCLALVGTSGSGKTTIARALVGLQRVNGGNIRLDGQPLADRARKRTAEQRRRIQIVLQDPAGSLNPRRTVGESIAHAHKRFGGQNADEAVARLLEQVHLPSSYAARLPVELSGGEAQRVNIARALAARPDVLVCDEITASLDVSVQARVLDLLTELRTTTGAALVFITHDLGVVAEVAQDVAVLSRGVLVEHGPAADVLHQPNSDEARALLAAAPRLRTQTGPTNR